MDFDQYVVVRLVRPDDYQELPPDEAMRVQDAHLANVADLHDRGLLVAAGPPADRAGYVRGFGIMTCDLATAEEIWAKDPGVLAGRFAPECVGWLVPKGMIVDGPGRPPRSVAEALG
jgi:uncharacterized protein YciI